jgi:hypothetical protein
MHLRNSRTGLLLIFFLIPGIVFSQSRTGRVLSSETGSGIGYVNIGLIGKNLGTVSDQAGNFTINLASVSDTDSMRFSMIGFESKTLLVRQFKEDTTKTVYLCPRSYDVPEVNVTYHRPRYLRLGNPVETNELRSGFSSNDLGSELGIRVNARKRAILKEINLDVDICTYDSVTYRLNIYLVEENIVCKNILNEPIYLSFTKEKISDVVTFDLGKYSIIVEGDILIALELYKDLGEGKLLFRTEYFTGTTYHRKTSEGNWTKSPGVIGMYLKSQVLN